MWSYVEYRATPTRVRVYNSQQGKLHPAWEPVCYQAYQVYLQVLKSRGDDGGGDADRFLGVNTGEAGGVA